MKWTSVVLLAALAAGCVDTGPRRQTVAVARPPMDAKPARVDVFASMPQDTNANGYVDTLPITVYIWTEGYPVSFAPQGAFDFRLKGNGGIELGHWAIPEDVASAAIRSGPAGPAYLFQLNMLEGGTDEVDAQAADLLVEFHPKAGGVVKGPVTSLARVGKVRG